MESEYEEQSHRATKRATKKLTVVEPEEEDDELLELIKEEQEMSRLSQPIQPVPRLSIETKDYEALVPEDSEDIDRHTVHEELIENRDLEEQIFGASQSSESQSEILRSSQDDKENGSQSQSQGSQKALQTRYIL
jgi:hypothetical protein